MSENMAKDLQYYVMFPCEVDISIDQEKTLKYHTSPLILCCIFYSCGLSTATIEYSFPSVCLSVCLCVCVCVCVCLCTG